VLSIILSFAHFKNNNKMTKLLINEHPLIVLPTLAVKVGLNESIILQQIHYWLDPRTNKNIKEGKYWVYNTYSQWQKQFPFLSEITIKRSIAGLEKRGLLISKNYNHNSFHKLKWYTINYKKLSELEDSLEANPSNESERSDRSDQNDPTIRSNSTDDRIKKSHSIKETETTTKTTTNLSLETKDKFWREKELIKIWNEVVEEGKKEINPTDDRLKLISKRFEDFFNESTEKWRIFCIKISNSKFLMGEVTSFRVSFDWALEPKSIVRILDGDYGIGDRPVGGEGKIKALTEEDLIREIKRTDYPEFWKLIQESLLISEGRPTYISWFRNLEFLGYEKGVLELKASTKFIALQLDQQFANPIKRASLKFLSGFKKATISHYK
jgi:hypothetical protein